ncbi:MAG: glycosyltransferase [Verrucomicrobiae bacterium]|nr:glycosyltransferase [Verrucomicrobiae bacterium]
MTPLALYWLARDRLRGGRWWRWPAALAWAWRGQWAGTEQPQGVVRGTEFLCRAIRLVPASKHARRWEVQARQRLAALTEPLEPAVFDVRAAASRDLEKAVLLKPPLSAREPGVLYIAFEYQWMRLLSLPPAQREEFARQYTLVLAPSWSPPHSVFNFYFPQVWPVPVFCQISHPADAQWLPHLSPRYRVVPLMPSHWVNPEAFAPRPKSERDLHLVMVANFAEFKRHLVFFHALRRLPRDWRVVLIGQREGGRTAKDIQAEAAAFGVADRFTLRESVAHAEVCDTLCRARASVVLSRREGACVVVAESLFADTPVGLIKGAHIGSGQFLNPQTGRWLKEDRLAEDLRRLVEEAHTCQPRAWALAAKITCQDSSRQLNELVRQQALADGQEWTGDLAPMQWRPNPALVSAADAERLAPACKALAARYGIHLSSQVPTV